MDLHGIGEFMYNSKYNDKMLREISDCCVPEKSPFEGGLVIDKFYAENLIKPLLNAFYDGRIHFHQQQALPDGPEETEYQIKIQAI